MDNKEIVSKVLSIIPGTKEILDGNDTSSEEKVGVGNIVTTTDKKLEDYLKKSLVSMFPNSEIVSEESAEETKISNDGGLKFIVDPLDGTTNFTNGWPHVVSIGIANNNELIGGVLYDAIQEKAYVSVKGKGVYVCDVDDILNLKSVVRPKYEATKIKKSVISSDMPYGKNAFKITKQIISNLYYEGASLKMVGPTALDVLKTALGKENRPHDYNDAVWHTEVKAWDLAAATAILREFGGEIIGRDGKPLSIETLTSPTKKISFVASGNPKMLEQLYSIYKKSEKEVSDKSQGIEI